MKVFNLDPMIQVGYDKKKQSLYDAIVLLNLAKHGGVPSKAKKKEMDENWDRLKNKTSYFIPIIKECRLEDLLANKELYSMAISAYRDAYSKCK